MDPNKNVVMWLLIFPPIGLVKIWTLSTWDKRKKVAVTILMVISFLTLIFASAFPIWYVEHIFSAY